MPLEDYSNYIYDFMETENCIKATVEDGTYDMEGSGGLIAATMTLVGEAREDGLRDEDCHFGGSLLLFKEHCRV